MSQDAKKGKTSPKTRIAAIGDIHVQATEKGNWEGFFRQASKMADILLLCGDLTDTGKPEEAEVLKKEMKACSIPVVAVLGNHDHEHNNQEEIKNIIQKDDVYVLDGESVVLGNIGFAGVKGFGGGFDSAMLSMFGEKMMKKFVQEAVDEALKLDRALTRLDSDHENLHKIALLHYAPIKATVAGEPEQIFPFLGSSRLAEPLNRREVTAVFHGHAHVGTLEGVTSKGVRVYNVAKPILQKQGLPTPFFIMEL